MSDELRRRSAVWRDIEFNLDHFSDAVEARKAEKWVDGTDKQELSSIVRLLRSALVFARARYRDVLNEQVAAEYVEVEKIYEQVH